MRCLILEKPTTKLRKTRNAEHHEIKEVLNNEYEENCKKYSDNSPCHLESKDDNFLIDEKNTYLLPKLYEPVV